MNQIQTIAKNTVVLMSAQIIVMILGLIFVICIARFLGAEGFGKYSFAFAFAGLFAVLADFGLNILTVREVARNKDLASKYIINIGIIKIILSFVTMILIVLAINLMNYPRDTTYAVYIFGLYVILISFSQIFRSIFQAFEVMEYESLITVLERLITVSLGLWVLFSGIQIFGSQLIALVSVFLVGGILSVIFSFVICFKKVVKIGKKSLSKEISIDFTFWKFLFKEGAPFWLQAICMVVYSQIGIIMLSIIKGDIIVGIYSAAYNLVIMLYFIPVVFNVVLFPSMSRFFISSKDSLKFSIEKAIKFLFIISFPIAVGTTVLSTKFILLLYGGAFSLSIIALNILIWIIPITFVNSVFYNALASINKQWLRFAGALICAIFNIMLNLILIPKYGFVGAGISTILTEFLLLMLYFYFIKKYYNINFSQEYLKIIINGVVMGILLYYFVNIIFTGVELINVSILISIGIITYFAGLFLLGVFDEDDKRILKMILRK